MKFLLLAALVCCANAVPINDKVPVIHLNSGHDMPQIGLGTWQAGGAEVTQAVKDAIEIGFRHIDTSADYGNEKEVGEGINAQIKAGVIKREDIFITTKVYPNGGDRQKALASVKNSLKQLNVQYIDLVLVHWHTDADLDIYKGLEDAFEQKLVRSIGVSNFNNQQVDALLKSAKVKPAVNQIDVHPKLNQDESIEHCNKLGIAITGFSPLGTGDLVKNPTLAAIGKKHNKTASQVAIRWQIHRKLIVIPKSIHKNYIKEDFEVFDFTLTDEEMKTIHSMH